jgi:hypothetical protein
MQEYLPPSKNDSSVTMCGFYMKSEMNATLFPSFMSSLDSLTTPTQSCMHPTLLQDNQLFFLFVYLWYWA